MQEKLQFLANCECQQRHKNSFTKGFLLINFKPYVLA